MIRLLYADASFGHCLSIHLLGPVFLINVCPHIVSTTWTDIFRYGSDLGYAPHVINLVGPPVVMYTSNGSNAVDFRLWATDIVGQNVTAGMLAVTCCDVLAV